MSGQKRKMPTLVLIIILVLTIIGSPAFSQEKEPQNTEEPRWTAPEALTEVLILRPVGLVGTIVGTAVFIGISPLTALASIADREAFKVTAQTLVVAPAEFTFKRPLGHYEKDYYAPPKQ
ncbi:conserved hypothetical protein [Nitrosococcus halophilus Nc 4]|uniref:Uncharacterized protein n=1 Tax=Nitrosococcus halophilus (strain Nc4) TaxID=472759 RepID=D5C107_NITHN|nr:hypothetical protein [Nitrosococcus halophilus]ADE14564.1 conserved hypothetical protein [Nitrosococcus halophilus Nc 4]